MPAHTPAHIWRHSSYMVAGGGIQSQSAAFYFYLCLSPSSSHGTEQLVAATQGPDEALALKQM